MLHLLAGPLKLHHRARFWKLCTCRGRSPFGVEGLEASCAFSKDVLEMWRGFSSDESHVPGSTKWGWPSVISLSHDRDCTVSACCAFDEAPFHVLVVCWSVMLNKLRGLLLYGRVLIVACSSSIPGAAAFYRNLKWTIWCWDCQEACMYFGHRQLAACWLFMLTVTTGVLVG